MSYAIESIAKSIGARRVGKHKATIDWLLTDSRSLSFPEETLFFALTTKRNSGARYIPDLYDRGVRNFVITEEDFKEVENGELRVESSMQHDGAQPTLNSQLSTLNFVNNDSVLPYTVRLQLHRYRQLARESASSASHRFSQGADVLPLHQDV